MLLPIQNFTSTQNILEDFLRGFVVERWDAGHELVETNAKRPVIDLLAMTSPGKQTQ